MRSSIYKLVKNLLFFLLFTTLIYCVLIVLSGELLPQKSRPNLPYKVGHNTLRLNEVNAYKNIDLLFLGSSHAYRGFDTRIFKKEGYSTFNLGSSAQTPMQTKVLVKRHLERLNPKLVIIEVYPVLYTTEGIEASLDLIANDTNDFETLKLVVQQNHLKIYNTLIYDSYKELFKNEKLVASNLYMNKADTYHKGGYVSRKMRNYKYNTYKEEQLKFNTRQLDVLTEILTILKVENYSYVLVQAPITPAKYASFKNNDEFDALMNTNGTYFNFNQMIHLDDSLHFYDTHHLNQKGVALFNAKLIGALREKGILQNNTALP